jgi:hypothetical protein
MNVTEVLQLADELIFLNTGKHLDDTQEAVLKGAWESKTYEEIAENFNLSERHVRDVGGKLWKILSEQLGEDIHKTNFHSAFERLNNSPSLSLQHLSLQQVVNIGINSNINSYPNDTNFGRSMSARKESRIRIKQSYLDLTLAPKIISFYNRKIELEKLNQWIFNQSIPLISVLGLSGIGKTYLVKKFVDLHLQKLDAIVWRSLKFPKSLDLLIDDTLRNYKHEKQESLDDKLKQLFDIFTNQKCLFILDDVQNIFITGQIAGQYQPEYKDYQKFLKMITETNPQSSVILISQEKCAEMNSLDQQLDLSKCLELSGLNEINILENTGLNNQDSWLQLIQLYEGNFNYLKDIVSLIQDVYDGEVTEFLAENRSTGILPVNDLNLPVNDLNLPIITQNMQSYFNDLFKRLSPIEQQIILELSKFDQPISRENLNQNIALSSVDFVKGLQSVQQRYLVTKIKQDKIMFKLSPVFREYVRNCCQ